jgi:hypothetical protein
MKAKEKIAISFSKSFPSTGFPKLDEGLQDAYQAAWLAGFDHAKELSKELHDKHLFDDHNDCIVDKIDFLSIGENDV